MSLQEGLHCLTMLSIVLLLTCTREEDIEWLGVREPRAPKRTMIGI